MFKGQPRNLYESDGGNFLHLAGTLGKFNNIKKEHLHRTQESM